MLRLAIALMAALGLHVLLLLSNLPEQQIILPEIKGSGHVTVSFVRSLPPVREITSEPVEEEPEQVEHPEELQQQELEVEEILPPVPKPHPRQLQPVKEKITASVETVTKESKEKKSDSLFTPVEPVREEFATQVPAISPSENEVMLSEVEALRSPEPIKAVNRPPVYPSLARKRGWQGTVLLEVDVLSDGMVKNVQVKESSSYELLDRKALEAVRKWQFSPGLDAGEPVPMKVLVPVHFLLRDN